MARIPWSAGPRRIPILAQGSTAVKLSPPGLPGYRDLWTGMVTTPTANRAIGDTTLSLNAPSETFFESGAHSTTNRLVGLSFKVFGEFYRITAQTAAAITFVSTSGAAGLHAALVANDTRLKIQADLPPSAGQIILKTAGVDVYYSFNQDTTTSGGSYLTLLNGENQPVFDNSFLVMGVPIAPIFITGSAGGFVELEAMAA